MLQDKSKTLMKSRQKPWSGLRVKDKKAEAMYDKLFNIAQKNWLKDIKKNKNEKVKAAEDTWSSVR